MAPRPKNERPTGEAWVTQIASWSIAQVKAAILDHESGDFRDSALLFDYMDRNPRINAALDTRCKGVVGLPLTIEPADASTKAKAYADEVTELWWTIFSESLLAGMLRSVCGMGFGPGEVTYASIEKRWIPTVHPWHCSNLYRNTYSNEWNAYQDMGQLLTIHPGDGQWLMLEASAHRTWMRGIVRCLSLSDTSRGSATTDWMRWSEKHGIAITKATLPQEQVNSDAGKAFAAGLRTMGREGVIKIPATGSDEPGWGVDYLEPKTATWQGFPALINQADKDVAIGILGQSLTTEVQGGSLAAAQVHELVRQDYIRADVQTLSTALRGQVLAYYMLYNHGPDSVKLTPWPKWDTSRPGETLERAKTLALVAESISKLALASPTVDVDALLDSFAIKRKGAKQ